MASGRWDGPYYFHNGNFYNNTNLTPTAWPNNTAGSSPAITDTADSQNIFQFSVTNSLECMSRGTITPVWFWNGPNTGTAPPSFSITETTKAFSRDINDTNNDVQDEWNVLDGQGDTPQSAPPGSSSVADTAQYSVQVQSDSYTPGEGSGYWALGMPIELTGQIDGQDADPPYNLYASVEMDASVVPGSGN